MKTIAIAATAAVALTASPVQAWWDNGHMLVGEVASMLMDKGDVATIENVLSAWNADFPNTAQIATAAIWADLLKCSSNQPYCNTTEVPSFNAMDKWHYVNLPLFANGAAWGDVTGLDLFAESFGGDAGDVVDLFLRTFTTSKSLFAANLALRQLIHIHGDVHNPMHAVGAADADNVAGDAGGNFRRFVRNCVGTAGNLHALYDSAGGEYTENWSPTFNTAVLEPEATALIKRLAILADPINMDSLKSLATYKEFYDAFTKESYFKQFIIESHTVARTYIYPQLNTTYVGVVNGRNVIDCPSSDYIAHTVNISKDRIALAGKRLSIILTQVAKQLRGMDPKL